MSTDTDTTSFDDFMREQGEPDWKEKYLAETVMERLVMMRKSMKISMADLARQLDIPKQRVNDYEKRHRTPSIKLISEWADVLDMDTPAIVLGFMLEQVAEAGLDPDYIIQAFKEN